MHPSGAGVSKGLSVQMYTNNSNNLVAQAPVYAQPPARISRMANDTSSLADVMALLQFDGAPSPASSHHLFRHRRLRAGQTLHAMGQGFNGLYVVRSGSMKSVVTHDDGNDNVIAFHMKGDMLGCDGIHRKQYCCDVVALTDCEVIRLPAEVFFTPGRSCDDLEQMLYWAISREITREQTAYAVSHAPRSEVRVARFLLQHSEGFARMGCSPRRFTLTMTRRDIGSYLSVTLETVSRALSLLHQLGIIEISNRDVTLLSMDALRTYEG
jgi:CRP/FNR family transcriptional regulator